MIKKTIIALSLAASVAYANPSQVAPSRLAEIGQRQSGPKYILACGSFVAMKSATLLGLKIPDTFVIRKRRTNIKTEINLLAMLGLDARELAKKEWASYMPQRGDIFLMKGVIGFLNHYVVVVEDQHSHDGDFVVYDGNEQDPKRQYSIWTKAYFKRNTKAVLKIEGYIQHSPGRY